MNKKSILQSNTLPVLGVGITYSSLIEPILSKDLINVIEIEPQTLWSNVKGNLSMPKEVISHLQKLPYKKLIHSIGLPVGGTFRGDLHQVNLLAQNIHDFNAPWASEHLGFNATAEFHTGFFLPPQQTEEGMVRAVKSICHLQNLLPVPFAVETGVNYLKPRKGEMSDGTFINTIVKEAGCGLLLDLHNLYANQLNGRQSIKDFLRQIDLENIWEIHLAGGLEMDGFWLDAHSGEMPKELIEIAFDVVKDMPNLKAIIYELLPAYVQVTGLRKIQEELHIVKKIWENRKTKINSPIIPKHAPAILYNTAINKISKNEWEETLGGLCVGKNIAEDTFNLKNDPGVQIIKKLVQEFRGSMLVTVFKLTSRFIMLALGTDVFKMLLEDFWKKYPPEQYASEEALHFANYLTAVDLKLPNLKEILEFEKATLLTLLDKKTRIVAFEYDPFPLLRCLTEGKLETMDRQKGNYEIEITGDTDDGEMWKDVSASLSMMH